MYLSMFMYRFLPLIATLAEGKPITYGFERPYDTFMYEIILFSISSLAFYLACKKTTKNNLITNSLYQIKFFEISPAIIWSLGLIGLAIRLYNFGAGDVEYGDVGGKFLSGLNYLMYAPLILIFPKLINIKYSNKKYIWFYTTLIFFINIASNSRQSIITPIGIIILLAILYIVSNNYKLTEFLSPLKIFFLVVFSISLISFLSMISTAMLFTRGIRADVSRLELFQETIEVMQNPELMDRLAEAAEDKRGSLISYQEGWTEDYVDNFMLARYANMRITDQTLYYAEQKGYGNRQMQILLWESLVATLPTPILRYLNIKLDKGKMQFSRGDFLYGSGFGGYRVTSHVGDGLATFSYWYFLIQFVVFFIVFKLLNTFVIIRKNQIIYAPYALMNIFIFLGMFRNAIGITADITFIIRGFLQGIVTYLILFYFVKIILKVLIPKDSTYSH
ncbi:hypothetical protein H0I23_12800 [Cellulophaga sp. HaHaR_3_176]|uniref:hypothetical protein n=1 Tax=Cellulophaga sp. HaHaR_3_176 TaxID=1942464 RepID=UPI001C1FEF27|nr:hypothetical protein [Cellulophaga sp. HaHaR_3_176]QWX83326.1 hypothetical protein H0I23_12800 [Cellulophaga sp. HaHaR_3_176]